MIGRLVIVACLAAGCASHRSGVIDVAKFPLDAPEKTFALLRLAIAEGDPRAAYHCLAPETTARLSFGRFFDGWSLLGRHFRCIAEGRVVAVADAPGWVRPARIVTFALESEKEKILLLETGSRWLIVYPVARLNDPDSLLDRIEKLRCFVRRRLPAERGAHVHPTALGRGWVIAGEKGLRDDRWKYRKKFE